MTKAEYMREWRARNKDKIAEHNRRYRENHHEEVAARKRVYHQDNAEAIRKRAAQWKRDNPERARELNLASYHKRRSEDEEVRLRHNLRQQRRSALKRASSDGGVLANSYAAVLYNDPCSYCGSPAEHIDHIVPLSRGGNDEWTNLTAACASCNVSKNASPLLEWLAS